MIYLPHQRAVFVHNPKCAGSSMVAALDQAFPERTRLWGRFYLPQQDLVRDVSHLRLDEMRQFLPAEQFPVELTFGVVRDPYTRFASAFKHFKKHSGCDPRLTVEQFMEQHFNHNTLRTDWRFVHFAPQYTFFFRSNWCCADLLGRFEALDEFADTLSARLGKAVKLGNENVGDAYAIDLSDNAIATINHYYANDFAYFGYALRTPTPRARVLGDQGLYRQFEALWPVERGLEISAKTLRGTPAADKPASAETPQRLRAA